MARLTKSADVFEQSLNEVLEKPEIKELLGDLKDVLIPALKSAHNFSIRLKEQPDSKRLLEQLRQLGCSQQELISFLFHASSAALNQPKPLFDRGGFSAIQLERLTAMLMESASLVEGVNQTWLNPALDLECAPKDPTRDEARAQMVALYDRLPALMQVYAVHLGQLVKVRRAVLKRMTLPHYYALKLLQYLENKTGSPRYYDAASLLEAGFAVLDPVAEAPKFFGPDALTKLYQRLRKLDRKQKN